MCLDTAVLSLNPGCPQQTDGPSLLMPLSTKAILSKGQQPPVTPKSKFEHMDTYE